MYDSPPPRYRTDIRHSKVSSATPHIFSAVLQTLVTCISLAVHEFPRQSDLTIDRVFHNPEIATLKFVSHKPGILCALLGPSKIVPGDENMVQIMVVLIQ